jgi:galactose mutarotase-like enzyme
MQILKNQTITIKINPKGAELTSVFNHKNQTEYMWSADTNFWGKSSPVLFPIVGALKDNIYRFEGKKYHLPRHGFAREREFLVENTSDESVTFLLTHDEETLKVYPFAFEFRLKYTLHENSFSVTYSVKNIDDKTIYFSVGGHPAFAVPLSADTDYEDYYLKFNQTENFQRWGLVEGGLIASKPIDFLLNTNQLALNKELFYDDAIVFKNLKSSEVILKSDKTNRQLKFDFKGFPYLGIWAAKDANFVCIEPWCGIADSENHHQELTEKEGIIALQVDEVFERTWAISTIQD